MDWMSYLPVIIPAAVSAVLAVLAVVWKISGNKVAELGKEATEFLLVVHDGLKDGELTPEELQQMIDELEDVIEKVIELLK